MRSIRPQRHFLLGEYCRGIAVLLPGHFLQHTVSDLHPLAFLLGQRCQLFACRRMHGLGMDQHTPHTLRSMLQAFHGRKKTGRIGIIQG